LIALACADSNGPGGRNDASLSIVRQDPAAPPLLVMRDSFWAKVGDGRELEIHYQGATPGEIGEEFLRFEVPGDALLRRPDGRGFAAGDSILITVTIVDPARFLFAFEPAGLVFSAEHPARLKLEYFHSEHDFNEDGVEDSRDDDIEAELDLWHRQTATAQWFKIGAVKFEELDEVSANIRSFSQYALAW
jgi:hypothetical protein